MLRPLNRSIQSSGLDISVGAYYQHDGSLHRRYTQWDVPAFRRYAHALAAQLDGATRVVVYHPMIHDPDTMTIGEALAQFDAPGINADTEPFSTTRMLCRAIEVAASQQLPRRQLQLALIAGFTDQPVDADRRDAALAAMDAGAWELAQEIVITGVASRLLQNVDLTKLTVESTVGTCWADAC